MTATFGPSTGLGILLLAKGGGDETVSAEPWVPRSRSHVVTFPTDLTDRAEMDSAITELAHQTLAEIVAQGRVVTRVAVTVRTNTFFTRTKIRKLAAPSTDARRSSTPRWPSSTSSSSTGRSACSESAWNSRCPAMSEPADYGRVVLHTVAVRGYRSLRELVLPLRELTVVTGANGTGKSSVYRSLRLLADCGRSEVIGSLAREGGLESVLWAGPEHLGGARRTGTRAGHHPHPPVSHWNSVSPPMISAI